MLCKLIWTKISVGSWNSASMMREAFENRFKYVQYPFELVTVKNAVEGSKVLNKFLILRLVSSAVVLI